MHDHVWVQQASGGPRLSLFGVSRMPILHATSMKLSEGEVGLLRIAEAGSPRGNNVIISCAQSFTEIVVEHLTSEA